MLFNTRRIFDYLERPKQKNDSKGNWNYCYEVRKIASTKRLFKKKRVLLLASDSKKNTMGRVWCLIE